MDRFLTASHGRINEIDALYAPACLSWTATILMSPKNQGKATKKQVVEPKRSNANPKTSKRDWALNSGLVISNVLYNVAEFAPIPALKYAAQAVATFLGTVEVCGGTSFDFCVKQVLLESPGQQRWLPNHRWWCVGPYHCYISPTREIWESEKVDISWD